MAKTFPRQKVTVKLWLPRYEYEMALANESLSNLLEEQFVDIEQIRSGLKLLTDRYKALVDHVVESLEFEGKVKLEVTDERSVTDQADEIEALLGGSIQEMIDREVTRIYGLYRGSELRRKLFGLLAFKHFQPLLEDPKINVLHIENSYELWPSVLAARWAEGWCARAIPECGELKQVFAFILTPPVPSPTLKYMRTLNAPYRHKFYLGADDPGLKKQFDKISLRYFKLLPVQIGEREWAGLKILELNKKLQTIPGANNIDF
jgi:hypothetical protein